jgi:hypothetical protein
LYWLSCSFPAWEYVFASVRDVLNGENPVKGFLVVENFAHVAHPRTYYAVLRSTTVVQFVFGRQNDDDAGGFEQSYDFRRVPRQKLIPKKYWSEYF